MVRSLDSTGGEVITEKQGLGKGFSPKQAAEGPVTTGCGHIMHYHCFEDYYSAAQRRHHHQVARNHPERLPLNEFVCPLCKALGNAFLPIIWKGKEESYPGALNTADSFNEFLDETLVYSVTRFRNHALIMESDKLYSSGYQDLFVDYVSKNFINPLSHKVNQLATPALPELLSFPQPTRMQMPGLYPPADEIISMGPTPTQPITAPATTNDAMVTELVSIYKQLRETIRLNGVQSQFGYQGNVSDDLIHTDVLIRTLGLSITAAEIAQRGVGYERQYHPIGSNSAIDLNAPSLPVLNLDILHVVRLCYVAEIVKTFLGYILRPQGFLEVLEKHGSESSTNDDPMSPHESLTKAMLHWLVKAYKTCPVESSVPEEGGSYLLNHAEDVSIETVKSLRLLVDKYALPFLRKAVILLHVRFGVEFPNTGSDYNDLAEIDRLATLLNLPSIDSIFDSLVNSDGEDNNNIIALLVSGWISHFISWFPEDSDADDQQQQQEQHQQLATLSLPHPAIFELVGLPKYFDTLLDEATRRRCKTTGKELTDPSICLFCGDIFCSQAVCCRGQGDWRLGGCNRHVAICGKNIGLFINIRKCMALFLHNKNGCWHHAPYLDIHGEVDPGFRHHRRLILNQKRYDRLLRDVWLSHGIPAVISRRLEAEINNGGWESI
ncbi:hypothetical protein HCDG_04336 [Histoplasma capsulatum H143]|uniref:E3 ubiquitin-protein ligase n=1 Tax=Ajellomyces capsulatus (strain H143) TaxID=544712 RepID=C6HDQ5_AJECH|nr:hypothetical protein HCDG_04336 [Histoplasma capsulatum H143]